MPKASRKLTEGEWAIMQVVWELEPVPAPTVQEHLYSKKKWAYTTVKTLMDRMVEKGLLTTERLRQIYLYSSAMSLTQARKNELMHTVKQAFNGALTPMMQFLLDSNDLSQEQLSQLESLIKKKRKQASKAKKR